MSLSREELIAFIQARDPHTVHGALGIRIETYDAEACVVAVDVDERLYQHGGIVHGGIYVLLAESAASIAAAFAVDMTRFEVAGMEVNANHLRKVTSGVLRATARPIHRGRSTLVYGIDVCDAEGERVCVSRCTVAVRARAAADSAPERATPPG